MADNDSPAKIAVIETTSNARVCFLIGRTPPRLPKLRAFARTVAHWDQLDAPHNRKW